MAGSYNELFEIGAHSTGVNLLDWYRFQDDAANGVVTDDATLGSDTSLKSGKTEDISGVGPNSFLAKSFDWNTNRDIDGLPHDPEPFVNDEFAIGVRFRWVSGGNVFWLIRNYSDGDSKSINLYSRSSGDIRFIYKRPDGTQKVLISNTGLDDGQWHNLLITRRSGVLYFYVDNTLHESATLSGTWDLTASNSSSYTFFDFSMQDQQHAEFFFRTAAMTTAERDEWEDGPEPNYVSGVSFDADGNYDVGTWGLPSPFASGSNGTITYEVVAANAAGSVVDSATGSSGTLDLSSEAGNLVYLLVKASNTGGYDCGDKSTRTSGYGSSGDGYYELVSVAAPLLTGLGPALVPAGHIYHPGAQRGHIYHPGAQRGHVYHPGSKQGVTY